MWKGIGRSGIGDQTIIGEYEDFDGLSMNGRQWKNRLTQETRDLSGADYWHQRKALEPKMAEDIPTFVHGRANVSAFADPITKPKAAAKKKTAFETVCTTDRTYEKLCNLSEELDQQLESGELSFSDWSYARKQLDKKLDRAWTNICKLRGWDDNGQEQLEKYSINELTFDCQEWQAVPKPVDYGIIPETSVFKGLSDNNVFKRAYKNLLTAANAVRKILDVSKNILEEGLI